MRRPGWIGWAIGHEQTEHLTVIAPVAHLTGRWMTVQPGHAVTVEVPEPVSAVAYADLLGHCTRARSRPRPAPSRSAGAPPPAPLAIAAAPRGWETVGAATHVSWFPASSSPVLAASPAPGGKIAPASPIYLTFSKPVSEVLGSHRPALSPATAGHWHVTDSHTLEFRPSGFGLPLGTQLHATLPRSVAVAGASSRTLTKHERGQLDGAAGLDRTPAPAARPGRLPAGRLARRQRHEVAHTPSAEAAAATEPPAGSFTWRYGNTPHQLKEKWSPTQPTVITKGAVMKFENENGMPVDGEAGPAVWRKLMADAIAGKRLNEGYSYVYVHREVPETATLWSAGHTVISAPANTGISGAETELGSFPVFEHLPETTMSGTNPDGSHYEDPGIKWVSYFNGGDALHNFNRSSFGTPQSLGCVELPLAASAEIYKYTPIGTVVTVET